MAVPFFTQTRQLEAEWPEISREIDDVFAAGEFVDGRQVRLLERALRDFTGAKHVLCISNGSDALEIMLRASGVGPGDEVIVPAYTFASTATSVCHVGARPVFTDIDPETYSMCAESLQAAITAATRAIMPVHLFNQVADMPRILEIARQADVAVLEDSAEAIGMCVGVDGVHAGRLGRAGMFSNFPTKTHGGVGDGGAVVTDDDQIHERCRKLYDHGRVPGKPGLHEACAANLRMSDYLAAVLRVRLRHLPKYIARRRTLARLYDERLHDLAPVVTINRLKPRPYHTKPVYYVYLIECDRRDELVSWLHAREIETETYYPRPLHFQPCFRDLGYLPSDFPNAERASGRAVALPLYPDLTEAMLEEVCDAIRDFYRR